jgi:hypothetical protein
MEWNFCVCGSQSLKGWRSCNFLSVVRSVKEKKGVPACQVGISDLTNEFCSNPILHSKEWCTEIAGLVARSLCSWWTDGRMDGWMVSPLAHCFCHGSFTLRSGRFLPCVHPPQTTHLRWGWLWCELINH